MSEDKYPIKLVSVEEANSLLPRIRRALASLRELRQRVLRTEAQIEIEEMTGTSPTHGLSKAAEAAIAGQMAVLQDLSRHFDEMLEELQSQGAFLKDLESGLVDFYSRRGPEIVFLCWREEEKEVGHWHPLEGGFRNRQSL
jgi:hypothetical protein